MESSHFHHALALLDWQIELGATEAICDAPIDRYQVPEKTAPSKTAKETPLVAQPAAVDPVQEANVAAQNAQTLGDLRNALAGFDHCELKRGARSLVFGDGVAGAKVMIVGEAPGREEDIAGRPFVGRAGQLLDRMLAAIDMGRDHAEHPVYITNVLPWRPPQNRDPSPDEIAMMRPFVLRHIALAQPKVIVMMGNIATQALMGKKGISRLRGSWFEIAGVPTMPMFHPAYLLRNPAVKKEAWADLLSIQARLKND
ncbi:MAG: uracil-DNA glycosylase [Roseobacter sp.]